MVDHHYYTFSSVFFYTNRTALAAERPVQQPGYGSYAPGAPDVFLTDEQWRESWLGPRRCYVVAKVAESPVGQNWRAKARCFRWRKAGAKWC